MQRGRVDRELAPVWLADGVTGPAVYIKWAMCTVALWKRHDSMSFLCPSCVLCVLPIYLSMSIRVLPMSSLCPSYDLPMFFVCSASFLSGLISRHVPLSACSPYACSALQKIR